jgi:hypothetical protein
MIFQKHNTSWHGSHCMKVTSHNWRDPGISESEKYMFCPLKAKEMLDNFKESPRCSQYIQL